ncbi:MAG: phosphate acyltransferase PlsX [Acidobacteria bacterium]|jgi:phosphate acyltransferase|nr:phosphate acyltransferase PlsX [Acidobacteriota bacterium]
MGGDLAPRAVIAGAVAAARDLGLSVLLVGPEAELSAAVAREAGGTAPPSLSILDAPEFIAMNEAPLAALRRKPRASIKVAAEAVARGDAQALYSAGHTGATLLAAHAAFGVLVGAERPALAVLVPTLAGSAVLLDTGATLECRPEHLRAFGLMGSAYAEVALGIERPRVGLLSVGEEAGKGTELVRESHRLLAASALNFVGNLEARDFFSGQADVIVCDGFTGNIALKFGEGLVEMLGQLLRQAVASSPDPKQGAAVVDDGFARLRSRVDSSEHGGAPLLGLNGLALVGHGRSDAHAVRNGIAAAARLADGQMVARLREALIR